MRVLGSAALPWPDFGQPIVGKPYVTSGWGRPRPNRNGVHEGLDFRATEGTPVLAVADGAVMKSAVDGLAGLMVRIEHPGGWVSRYMHLSRSAVSAGDHVRKGQTIGLSGSTGITQSAAHLHFDLHLRADLLPAYIAEFGAPANGFGTVRSFGTAVPSEPLIPVDAYAPVVVTDAMSNGIPLYASHGGVIRRLFRWEIGVTLLGAGILGWATIRWWRRRRRRLTLTA